MNIINLNSNTLLPDDVIEYARSVIRIYEIAPGPTLFYPSTMADLMRDVPVFLVDVKTQVDYGGSDLLGFYCHEAQILGPRRPVIGICVERLRQCAVVDGKYDHSRFTILTAKVLIHELAHALMALTPSSKSQTTQDMHKWVEEPMANLITLEYFSCYRRPYRRVGVAHYDATVSMAEEPMIPNPYEVVRSFMLTQQPPEYQLGVHLFDKGIRQWWLWRNHKSEATARVQELSEWMNLFEEPGIMPHLSCAELATGYAKVIWGAGKVQESAEKSHEMLNDTSADHNGCTPLHYAVLFGNDNECRQLLEHGNAVDAIDAWGCTPLAIAKARGDRSAAASLLASKADWKRDMCFSNVSEIKTFFGGSFDCLPEGEVKSKLTRQDRGRSAFGM